MRQGLAELEALAQIVLDAELAQLDQLSRQVSARKAEIKALGERRTERAEALKDGSAAQDLAFLTGQDGRWSAWIAQEAARLSRELARIAAQREAQRLRAQAAFGKRDALRRMRETDTAARRQERMRRGG